MEPRVVIQHNSDAVAKAIEKRGEDAIAAIDRNLGRGAMEVAREAQRTMPKFRSETVKRTGSSQKAPLEWHVVFDTRHAFYTEEGTGPGGSPPLAEMIDWIRMKGIVPRTPGMTIESLAHVIRDSITATGTEAQPFAGPALEAMRPRLIDLVRQGAMQGLEGRA